MKKLLILCYWIDKNKSHKMTTIRLYNKTSHCNRIKLNLWYRKYTKQLMQNLSGQIFIVAIMLTNGKLKTINGMCPTRFCFLLLLLLHN